MILDNEEQRQMLTDIINAVPIQGDYKGIVQMIPKIAALLEAVQTAKVEVANGSDEQ